MLKVRCPNCKKMLSVPDTAAGKKARCPDCKTITTVPEQSDIEEVEAAEEEPEPAPRPRKPLRRLPAEEEDDEPARRSSRGFRCPYCQSSNLPIITRETKPDAMTYFIVLLIFCFPLCWIPLLMKEDRRKCINCGMKLG